MISCRNTRKSPVIVPIVATVAEHFTPIAPQGALALPACIATLTKVVPSLQAQPPRIALR